MSESQNFHNINFYVTITIKFSKHNYSKDLECASIRTRNSFMCWLNVKLETQNRKISLFKLYKLANGRQCQKTTFLKHLFFCLLCIIWKLPSLHYHFHTNINILPLNYLISGLIPRHHHRIYLRVLLLLLLSQLLTQNLLDLVLAMLHNRECVSPSVPPL